MAERELSDEEAKALGLHGRELSDEEATKLGLASGGTDWAGTAKAGLRGGLQGFSLGTSDEIAGAMGAGLQGLVNVAPEQFRRMTGFERADMGDAYQSVRDMDRADNAKAKQEHGTAFGAGELGGAMLAPVPGTQWANSGGLLARVGKNALLGSGVGGVAGAGSSESGSLGGVGRDALMGGALGGAGGAVGGALGAGLDALGGKASQGVATAQADALAKESAKAEKLFNSARGEYGSAVQSASRDLEVLERAAQGGGDTAEAARAYLETPEAQSLRDMVARSKLQSAPERVGTVTRLHQAMQDAAANQSPTILQEAADESLANPLRSQLAPRLKTYLNRSVPAAIGSAMGGPAGMVAGTVMANTLGKPTTAMANAMQSPALRNLMWKSIGAITPGATSAARATQGLESLLPLEATNPMALALRQWGDRKRALAEE